MKKREESKFDTFLTEAELAQASLAPTSGKPRTKSAKSTNEDYTQATVYIRRDTYGKVKLELVKAKNKAVDFSDLIENLLQAWLKEQTESSLQPRS